MFVESEEVTRPDSQLALCNARYDVLVLDARARQSLVTVRSLGSRGLRVAAVEQDVRQAREEETTHV